MNKHINAAGAFGVVALAVIFTIVAFVSTPTQSRGNDVSGVITGYVNDGNNHPLDGARVTLRSSDTPIVIRTANNNGFFAFVGVLPGDYVVEAQRSGFDKCAATFSIHANEVSAVNFRLLSKSMICYSTVQRLGFML